MTTRAVGHDVLELLSESAERAVLALDENEQICLFNSVAVRTFKLAAANVLGKPFDEHFATHPEYLFLKRLVDRVVDGQSFVQDLLTQVDGVAVPVVVVRAPANVANANSVREIVHNLKSPISGAMGFIDIARTYATQPDRMHNYLKRAQHSLDTMLNAVNELLDFAWLEVDGDLNLAETDLNELAEFCVRQMEGYAQRSELVLTSALSLEPCPLLGDERRLVGAIINLISNAIKYSPAGGTVRIVVDSEGERARLRVFDQGMGIAPEHLSHVWEPYYRAVTTETRRIEGSGLGLSIVKAVIEKHGGEVFMTSTLGAGSMFGFWLALKSSEAEDAAP